MNILIFGASITWGSFDLEAGGWVERLKQHYFHKRSASPDDWIHVYNLGISGQTTTDLVERFEQEAKPRLNHTPDRNLIIISIGANDSVFLARENRFGTPVESYAANMTTLIELAQHFATQVIITTIPPVNEASPKLQHEDKVRKNEFVERYNAQLNKIASQNQVELIDIYSPLLNHPEYFSEDGLHPNSQGHLIIAQEIRRQLEKLLTYLVK